MGDSFRRNGIRGELSQWSYFWTRRPLFLKKLFSGSALIFFGFVGGFPALPTIDPKQISTIGEETETVSPAVNSEERCRWQKDFSFFSALSEGKNTSEEGTPCSEKLALAETNTSSQTAKKDGLLSAFIEEMATGYPIEVMAPTIAEYDRNVAALIVGIAKKESNWGKRVPRTEDGADCFNYWGFKGAGSRGIAMGHGCFGSPEEAVHAVGNRLAELVEKRKTSEPKNMIIWKCGSSCATHSPESVRKWIADVDLYYRQIVRD